MKVRYRVEISRSAEGQLRRRRGSDRQRLADAMLALADDPRPKGTRKLAGYDDMYRIRVGRYRIVYSLSEADPAVLVLKIGHRANIYQ